MTATIIQFPSPLSSPHERIEIWCGRVKDLRSNIVQHLYFVEYVESDGARNCVHEANTWSEAYQAAREWGGLRIVDKTEGVRA